MVRFGSQRDLLGQETVDFDERVDVARLKKERLARLQGEMAKADLGGILIFDPVNIRYATGHRQPGVFGMRSFLQYAIVPQEGDPWFSDYADDGCFNLEKGILFDFFPTGQHAEEAARHWGDRIASKLKEMGILGQRLGFDRLEFNGMESLRSHEIPLADARIPFERARSIKTEDEVSLIRQACAVADISICAVRDAIKPGVTEQELFAVMTYTNLKHGGEHMDARLMSAGGNTNPWGQGATDRIVRPGDLVGYDTDMAGPMGYFADFSRTYLCGDDYPPTSEQLEAYKLGYNFIYESLEHFQVGAHFQEIAEKCPEYPEEYRYQRYPMIAHGDGMSDEWPCIYWPDQSWSGFGNDDEVLQENMVLSLEGLASKRGARESVKLEEEILITKNGPEVLSNAPFDDRFVKHVPVPKP